MSAAEHFSFMWRNSGVNWICFPSKSVLFQWALIGSDLLHCWVKFPWLFLKLLSIFLGSLIFIFSLLSRPLNSLPPSLENQGLTVLCTLLILMHVLHAYSNTNFTDINPILFILGYTKTSGTLCDIYQSWPCTCNNCADFWTHN